MADLPEDTPMVWCWCVPDGKLYVMQANPCTWPECVNGSAENPQEAGERMKG